MFMFWVNYSFNHIFYSSLQVYIAAFAVSAYACSFTRAGGKPFNPILGETYECLRPDKGFRFIAEQVSMHISLISSKSQRFTCSHEHCVPQVSHHPPVSACHCESKNYTFWQGKYLASVRPFSI